MASFFCQSLNYSKKFNKQIVMQLSNNQSIHQEGTGSSERWKPEKFSAEVLSIIFITLAAISLRLYFSFSHELISGMDGGYYPLQVRNILNTGFPVYPDFPLYFYFCALLIKSISFLGFTINDGMIITVIKIVDSLALPMLAFPLFRILTKSERKIPLFAKSAIVLFAVSSATPLIILGDLQKNAFAIPFVFLFVWFFENYLITPEKRSLIAAVLSLVLIALIHFGVFVFCLVFLILSLFVVYRKKAILPSIIVLFLGFAMILMFDSNRAYRLLTFWNVIFENPVLFQGPLPMHLLLNVIISLSLAASGFFQYLKYSGNNKVTEYLVFILSFVLVVFALPVYDSEYFNRFNVLLFVPQSLLILYLIRMNQKFAVPVSILLILITSFSIFTTISEGKQPCIDEVAYQDLQNLKKHLPDDKENTIIIAEHGLEFWTAWALNVKVGQERAMNKINSDKYRNITILRQKNEVGRRGPGNRPGNRPMPGQRFKKGEHPPMGPSMEPPTGARSGQPNEPPMGPPLPENFKLVYSSPYFNAYQNAD